MRVFLDTNVFLEYLCGRSKALIVRDVLDIIDSNGYTTYLSSSSFCTIAYYVELSFKQLGFHKPEKTDKTREVLRTILDIATIADIDHTGTVSATNDISFSDFEDSVQYQCALKANCDVIVTFNSKDYKNVDQNTVKVLTPEQFLNLFH